MTGSLLYYLDFLEPSLLYLKDTPGFILASSWIVNGWSILAVIFIIVLALLAAFFFVRLEGYKKQLTESQDIVNKKSNTVGDLNKTNAELAKANQELTRESKNLKNITKIVLQGIEQGIIIIDEQRKIGKLHSEKMEEILGSKDFIEKDFLRVIQPRILPKDYEALVLFMDQLFNPKVREEDLVKLNPVELVEFFTEHNEDGSFDSRFVSISFNRITRQNKIIYVLVSVLDETERVEMKKKLEASEAKNKREADQLLSILRVDPNLLKDYLDSAKEGLQGISNRYEGYVEQDFSDLINFTFNIIHVLKGDALLIDLQILADRFHEIENTITNLRKKEKLMGVDFIRVLYDINDTNLIIYNLQKLLNRLSSSNKGFTIETNISDSNELFINSLNKGLLRMTEETGKRANLKFIDHDLIIPEKYKLSIKNLAIQLMRNSLTHGIEKPEDRVKVGKPEISTINMTVDLPDQNTFTFSYHDDGRGLNLRKITEKALEKNLITNEELKRMGDDEMIDLIFLDNLSTADGINQYAGRGQGLSFVKSITEKYNGRYTVSFKEGKYFKMNFAFPMDA